MRNNQSGVALITVVIVMLTMALIGASLAELSSAVNFSVDTIVDETKARYLAEAGIAHALHHYTALIAHRLGVGASPNTNGLTPATLHEAQQQLDELDALLTRTHHARLISPTRYDLITSVRKALAAELAALQCEAPVHE